MANSERRQSSFEEPASGEWDGGGDHSDNYDGDDDDGHSSDDDKFGDDDDDDGDGRILTSNISCFFREK